MTTPVYPPGPLNEAFGSNHLKSMRDDLIGFGRNLVREYGDVAYFRLGPHHCYQFIHPDHIAEILIEKARHFRKSQRLCQVFGRFEGKGLIVSDGEHWLKQRRLIQPSFQPSMLQHYSLDVKDVVHEMLLRWRGREQVDYLHEMMSLAMNVLTRSLFSTSMDPSSMDHLQAAVAEIQRWAIREFNRVIATPRWFPLIGQPSTRNALKFLDTLVWEIIRDRQRSRIDVNDLLGRLLTVADDNGQRMPLRQVRDELVTLLLAGHETMGVALTWTGWLLAAHPEIQTSLAQQVKCHASSNPLTTSNEDEFNAITAAFQETLRLYPPVYSFTREVTSPVQIGQYDLLPGSQIFLSPYLTQHDERWFPDPDMFEPERFHPGWESRISGCAFFPFGAGPRGCIGRNFAYMEATIVLTAILQQCQLRPLPDQQIPRLEQRLSLHPKDGLKLAIAFI
jgi:cytochrome P450